jgi:adenylate cyclase
LQDAGSSELVPRVAKARDGSPVERASISRTVTRLVITERVGVLSTDVRVDPRVDGSESLFVQDVRSFMCAPLSHEQNVIGVLYVDTPRAASFAAPDLELLIALSNYAAVAIEQARLATRLSEETRRRERLQRYHSPGVVDRILEQSPDADAPFIAEEREVSVLFADIVGFTTLCEKLPAAAVARLLNSFFARMADVIFQFDGTLDKFIGDALLAVFGAPLPQPDHALRCVRAAQAMRRALQEWNDTEADRPLEIRIGINSGTAVAADIGSPRRREYTVLGDVVNIASRIESSVAKSGQIVISRATLGCVGEPIAARPLGCMPLRGRDCHVELFAVEESR